MSKKVFLTNKYTISVFILLACLAVDILLHKGMSRVIIPSSFTEKRKPGKYSVCQQQLNSRSKHWLKAVNDPSGFHAITEKTGGIEADVYFDTTLNQFLVYHDSSNYSRTGLESILDNLIRYPGLCLWLDFKNLDPSNSQASLFTLKSLREKYQLSKKIIVESSSPELLIPFCKENFFTSYYIPYFNPYNISENVLVSMIDTISHNLSKYPASALSGYYFQYPVLKKYFPDLPVLTWTDQSGLSLVSSLFNKHLESEAQIRFVLYPQKK